ncbi:MAG TPA: HD domain-containing phosphohydrolase [Candidatus Cryosericum sp.]
MRNESVPRRVLAYIVLVTIAACAVGFIGARFTSGTDRVSLVWFVVVTLCVVVADVYPIVSFGFGGAATEVTVSLAITFAVACIWPPVQGMVLVAVGAVISDIAGRKTWEKIVFNASHYAITVGTSSIVYRLLSVDGVGFLEGQNLLALVVCALLYFSVDALVFSGLFATLTSEAWPRVFVSFVKQSWLDSAALIPLGIVLAALFRVNPLAMLLLVPTFLLLYSALKREEALRNQTQAILEKLVDVLESKSPETAQHSKRVRAWVEDICNELGLENSESLVVIQAAVLHDLGKVGLDDELLRKPGLSPEEFHQIMGHSSVSAGLLEGLTLFQGGRDIVLHHHERYDGNGYPDHLKGEAIPLGARIIAIADSFDAMVSMRPYRAKSLTVEEALGVLDHERGAQFDPELVTVFSGLIRRHLAVGDMANFPPGTEIGASEVVSTATSVHG